MFELIFDLETKKFFDDTGTFDPADLGENEENAPLVLVQTLRDGKKDRL